MTSFFGDNEWLREFAATEQLSSDQGGGDGLCPHFENSANDQEFDNPFNIDPFELDRKLLEPLPQNVQAMTSSTRRLCQPLSFSTSPHLLPQPVDDGKIVYLLPHHSQPSGEADLCKEDFVGEEPVSAFKGVGNGKAPEKLRKEATLVAREKRFRSPDWSTEEKGAYLQLKVEALGVVQGKDWDFISQGLGERHGFERSPKCCEDLWGTLRKTYKAIEKHNDPQRSNRISYWEMEGDARARNKLPRVFPKEWYNMMMRILTAQAMRFGKKSSRGIPPLGDGSLNLESHEDQRPMSNYQQKYHIRRKGSTGEMEEDLQIKQQIEDTVDAALQRLGNIKGSSGTREEDDLVIMMSTLAKQKVEYAVNSALERIDDDDRMANIAPFLKDWMKDVLHSSLQPVSSALQAIRNQEEQEDQARLRAIGEQRRALDLEEMQIKRQRVGRHQRPGRVFSKQQVLRIKSPVAEGIIPA
jgi:hypothetical protein